ncbi:MAG TPA: YbaK/EbsC family protein [Candidatus Saccharimonadales bacterium]|nr:YbaK/EbsC family protein [Candidatus Saccharimonadales bacterium]
MNETLLLPIVLENLNKFEIKFDVLECDDKFADTAAFCEHYGYTAQQSANTILVAVKKNDENVVACVLLADSRLDVNKTVCKLMGTKRASFASADQTKAASGMEIGGVTIFGLPISMPVYVDSRVLEQPEVVMGGGNRTSKLVLDPTELEKLPNVEIIVNLAKPVTA